MIVAIAKETGLKRVIAKVDAESPRYLLAHLLRLAGWISLRNPCHPVRIRAMTNEANQSPPAEK